MLDGQMINLYLFGAFLISMASFPLAKYLANKFNIVDIPNAIKVHKIVTPRTGGLMIFIALLSISLLLMHYIAWWYILSLILTFVIGFCDDISSVKPHIRLFAQSIVSTFFIILSQVHLTDCGIFIIPFAIAIPFTIFCIVGVTNAYNIIDGLNGLCSGCGFIFFILTSCIAYLYNDQTLFVLSLLFASSLLGFIIFNFPMCKIFLGDGGSYLIGFLVATMALMVVKRNPEVSPWTLLLLTIIPVFDVLFAMFRRSRLKRPPLEGDRRHLHHILRRRYKSNTKAVIVIWSIQSLIGITALFLHEHTLLLVALTIFSMVFLRRLWFKQINIVGLKV